MSSSDHSNGGGPRDQVGESVNVSGFGHGLGVTFDCVGPISHHAVLDGGAVDGLHNGGSTSVYW